MPLRVKLTALTAMLIFASLACNTATSMLADLLAVRDVDATVATQTSPPRPTAELTTPPNPHPGPVGLGDVYYAELGNGGYDVRHYHLVLDVDVLDNFIRGLAQIQLTATQRLSSLNLELYELQVDEVRVNGERAEFHRQGVEMTIFLPLPADMGDELLVEVLYQGRPGESRDDLPQYSQGWINYGHGILVAGEPTGASTWYPVNEHPSDKATYSYSVTVDARYDVAANGLLTGVEQSNGHSTYHWAIADPIAPYLTTLGIAEFDLEESRSSDGLLIRNYFGSGVSREVRNDFARTAEMLDYFEGLFGPYPYEAYGVVVHDMPLNFALETATLSVFGNSFTDEYVVVHELAHHWFGNAVGLKQWQDIWLNEGFATYASDLWNEHTDGRPAMERNIRSIYESLAAYAAYNQSFTGDPGANWLFDYASVYARGGLVLHALRLEIGDQAFFETLRTYTTRFGGGNASTADFIATTEEMAGRDLGAFFDAWLYQLELPDIPQMGLYAADYQE